MDEACAAFMAQVCDGAMTQPETPRALDAASEVSDCCSPRFAEPRLHAAAGHLHHAGTWEALPPDRGHKSPLSARLLLRSHSEVEPESRGSGLPASELARVETTWSKRREGTGQGVFPNGTKPPVLGGFVPEAGRPTLLHGAPPAQAGAAEAGAQPGRTSVWRRREEL